MLFQERLNKAFNHNRSLVCVGLDPDPNLIPISDVLSFNKAIVNATADFVCAYKPNLAFFEALGISGLETLKKTVEYIRLIAPNVLIVGDCKRGDVGHASYKYAQAMFDVWGFDAVTVNAYAGRESIEPFLQRKDKGVIIWCRASNKDSVEFQDQVLASNNRKLYETVASNANLWNTYGNIGLVVGATYPKQLATVRELCPDIPILMPGVGAQGGELQTSVKAGIDAAGRGLIVSSSRGILYASRDEEKFEAAAKSAAQELRDSINAVLDQEDKGW